MRECVGDDVLVEVIAQVIVETGADVLVDRFQFDEDQGQAVDETDQIGAAVIARRAQAGDLQLPDGEKSVVGPVVRAGAVLKVDDPRVGTVLAVLRVTVSDGYAVAEKAVELFVLLDQRAGEIVGREFCDGLFDGSGRKIRIEARHG